MNHESYCNSADSEFPTLRFKLLCLVCLYIMAGLALWDVTLVQLAETVLLVAAGVIVIKEQGTILKQPLFWLTLFFIVYVVIRGWIAATERPDLAYEHWESTRRWFKAGLLPALLVTLALWVTGRKTRHNMGLLLTAFIGLTCMLFARAEWSEMLSALQGKGRYVFDMHMALSSLLFTLTFVGTVIYLPRIVRLAPGGLKGRTAAGIIWGCVAIFYLTVLVATGTRASWVAGTVGLLTVSAVVLKAGIWRPNPRTVPVLVVGLAAVIAIVSTIYGPRIAERWQAETGTMNAALQLAAGDKDVEDLPNTPLSIRVAYNIFGLQQLAQRPFFGYGPADPRYLRDERGTPYQLENRIDHFHSQYVDPLLRFGIVGYLPVFSLFILTLIGVRRGWKSGRLDTSTGLFVIGFVTVYAVWSLADQRFTNFTMIAIVSIITGIGCSHLFPEREATNRTNTHSGTSATAETS